MLTVSPEKRININEVLVHSWLRDSEMRDTVNRLISKEDKGVENDVPRMEPPIAALKRARVE